MTDNKDEPKQKTKPYGKNKKGETYDPIEIPVPQKKDVLHILKKSVKPIADNKSSNRK